MFGRYLATFYFRDKFWLRGLLPDIFPDDPERKYLYIAAWEGYLNNILYKVLFFDSKMQKLYERGLNLKDVDYPNQKHFKHPDDGIAAHLALAFIYFPEFGFDHKLFKQFWKINNLKRHRSFIAFIGNLSNVNYFSRSATITFPVPTARLNRS